MTDPSPDRTIGPQTTSQRLHEWFFDTTGRTFSRAQKLLLLASIALAVLTAVLVQRLLHAPQVRGFSPALMQNSPPALGLLSAGLAIVAGAAVCTLAVGRIRPDAGIFCAALALLAFRFHTGPTRLALMNGGKTALFNLATELAVIGLTMVGAFLVLRLLVRSRVLPDDGDRDGAALPDEKLDQKLLCTATTAVVMAVIMMLLCQSDDPGQTLWSVFIASWLGTWCSFRFAPVAPSVWYWAAPLALGVVGYAWIGATGSATASIGVPGGFLSALARAAPLDYASVGVAGALIGYWTGRRYFRERAEADSDTPPPPPEEVTYSRG